MTLSTERQTRLIELIDALCDGSMTPAQAERLEAELLHDAEAQWFYLRRVHLHGTLKWTCMAKSEWQVLKQLKQRGYVGQTGSAEERIRGEAVPSSAPGVVPPIILDESPSPRSWLSNGFRVGGFAFSYGVSAVVMVLLIVFAWASKISYDHHAAWVASSTDAKQQRGLSGGPAGDSLAVAHVTGLVDCEWSNPQESLPIDARVPQGRAIALASGLLEITYDSGAKVILEGPCSYEVESPRGGFLSLGKLTARVEKEGLGIRDLGLASNTTVSRHSNPQSLIPNPLFTVRTPTATVTDLGTEFGVEVSKDRRNSVRVYQGRVAVASTKIKKAKLGGMVLHAGQSASLDAGGAVTNVATVEPRGKTPGSRVAATEFVRQLPKRIEANGRIDLLDIVAGGDGFGNRRGSGIDPATGEKVDAHAGVYRMSGPYHRVTWTPLIDGVFVPNSSKGPVQLDSAGHGIDGLAASVGRAYEVIWAARNASEFEMLLKMPWFGQLRRNDPNVTDRTGVLVMHADMGMTFDLAAIRKAHPEIVRLLRFRSVAGIAHFGGVSDISVFVDGKPRWNHRWCADWSGPAVADVSLPSDARFLTFVVTDSDGNISCDYTAFVAPVLEVVKRENKALKQ